MSGNSPKVVAIEHITLDGVYQAPARPDEDRRDGFEFGGWSIAGNDPKMQEVIGRYMSRGWSLLVGRVTYEDLFERWPKRDPESAMTKALTEAQKFVVSHNADYPLLWANAALLTGEAVDTVRKLKQGHDKTLIIFGSGALINSLMQDGLVDEFVLMTHPVVLGKGRRLFNEATPYSKLKLIDTVTTGTGVQIATYQVTAD